MNKVYAVSDLHGRYDLWKKISDYCDDSDVIYYLGDAVDRGLESFKLFTELLKDKRVIFICGNHEAIMAEAIVDYLGGDTSTLIEWCNDGGVSTWYDIEGFSEDGLRSIVRQVWELPLKLKYTREDGKEVYLSHAGFSPWSPCADKESFLLQDRKHMKSSWHSDEKYENIYIVHGHTPTEFCGDPCVLLPKTCPPEIYEYAEGHKIDIDTGAVWTGVTALLDLDTFTPIYFKIEKEE